MTKPSSHRTRPAPLPGADGIATGHGVDRVGLWFVGLMWSLPFLVSYRYPPISTFFPESMTFLLGICAMVPLCSARFWTAPQVPRVAAMPVAIMLLLLLQVALQRVVFAEHAVMAALYLLLAAALMVLGRHLREQLGIHEVVRVLSVFLVVGGELSALIGILQLYGFHTILGLVIHPKASAAIFGNLAQPNHYANYTSLGLIALGWLYARFGWSRRRTVLLALPLLFVLALSGSRSAALYWIGLSGLTIVVGRREASWRPLQYYTAAILLGYFLMVGVVQIPWVRGVMALDARGVVTGGERLFQHASGTSSRVELWKTAEQIFVSAPILGVGYGQFGWQNFLLGPERRQTINPGLYNNAHNIVFQLAAEMGVLGVAALFLPVLLCWRSLRSQPLPYEWWWGAMLLLVEATHSMLEYPLWYVYFLGIAAFSLGLMDRSAYRLELRAAGRLAFVGICLMGVVAWAQTGLAYRELERLLARRPPPEAYKGASAAEGLMYAKRLQTALMQMGEQTLLRPYARVFLTFTLDTEDRFVEQKRRQLEPAMHFAPTSVQVQFEIILLVYSGDQEQARRLLECLIWAFPGEFEAFREELRSLAARDPARFSDLIDFGSMKYADYQRVKAGK